MIVPRILSVKYSQGQDFTVSFEGEALNMVKSSDVVKPSTVIFEGDMSEVLQSINLCRELSVLPDKAKSLLLVSDGEIVDKGSVIARRTISMGIAERVIKSEIDGRLCLDRLDSGIVDIMSPFTRSSVTAGVNGRVKSVFHGDGMEQKVIITIDGYVSSAFMILGESISGNICLIKNGDSVYLPADVTSECKGKIVVAGMFLTLKLYDALVVAGAKGIIVGGLSHGVFESIKESAVPVFVTEGWGTIPINSVFLELLCKENGSPAEIDKTEGCILVHPFNTSQGKAQKTKPDDDAISVVEASKSQIVQVWDLPYWGYSGEICDVLDDEDLLQIELASEKKIVVNSQNVVVIG